MLIAVVILLSVFELPNLAQPQQPGEAKFVINDTAFQLLFRRKHNAFRSKVAMVTTVNGVNSSWAKRLYTTVNAMVCDSGPVLNATAPINGARVTDSFLVDAAAHELSDDFDAVELGRNYFSTVTDAQVDTEQLVENALDSWKKGNSSLSQLLLAKATRLGCAYKLYGLLSRDDIKAAEVLCTYDHRFYEGTLFEEGKPCDKKSDCTTYGNRSVCRPKQHLCAVKHYNTFLEK